MGSITTIIVMFNCFEAKLVRNFIGYALILFNISSMVVGTYGRERFLMELKDSVPSYAFAIAIWIVVIRIFQKVNTELIDNLQSKIEEKTQFELIVQNLEESIVIISENRMQMVNQHFMNYFR
jgi:hypothetical protein